MKPAPQARASAERSERHSDKRTFADIPSPKLSDDAVVQIHDFIHHILDLFEARYGDQIHRFYADLCEDCFIDSYTSLRPDDPPF